MKKDLSLLIVVLLLMLAIALTSCEIFEGKTTTTTDQGSVEHKHSFSGWIILEEATKTEDGLEERYCECGEVEKKRIPYIGSEGLEYKFNSDRQSYSVVGGGTCKDLDIIIPDTYFGLPVTSIADEAFDFRISITSVVIPNSVTSIGSCAFAECNSLTSVVIPDSVISIGDDILYGCDSLTSIEVDKNNEYYCSIDGNLYNKDATTLIKYAIGKTDTSFTIPDSVTNIGDWAFMFSSLTSIVIPDSVTSIGYSAFSHCLSLASIEIPDSVTGIGWYAFYNCTSLTSIVIPDSVMSIGSKAFWNCSHKLTIYCETESKPYRWNDDWNPNNRTVVWGYKGE